ncbi:MAG: glycosyltransferase family 4 protein [Armatimonadota bacterium]|nr:glycosyltransferase family 4 protein [Armatimonadota bacterium]
MLVGVGFFPHTVAGDKNFWIRMSPLLQERGARLIALSINDRTGVSETPSGLKIINLKRSFHLGGSDRFFAIRGDAVDYKHKHHRARDSMELLLTTVRNLRTIKEIVKSEKIDIIHFMDNMGPAMRFLKSRIPEVKFTNSQIRYNGGRMYENYIRASMLGLDTTVAYSESCRQQLMEAGLPKDRVTVIRWGVMPPDAEPDPAAAKAVRDRLGVVTGANLILWSGFILHIQRPEFEAAISSARKIAAERPDCHFVFSFKPLCFSAEFKEFEAERVQVYGDLQDFQTVLASADFFYSPSCRPDVSIAPPLTWLEAMSYGTPVITTQASGVEEVIEHGSAGYLTDSMETIPQAIDAAVDAPNRAEVRRNCRAVVQEKFDIRNSAEQYVSLWKSLLD